MTLSIIVPTCGRRTLKRALRSALPQLEPGDEIQVVGDGPQPVARAICDALACPALHFSETAAPAHDVGGTPRHQGMARARGDYLAFLDDDDTYLAGALARLHGAMDHQPGLPFLWRFIDHNGGVLWAHELVKFGNVGTPCILFPNDPARLGVWRPGRGGDYWFIKSTLDLYPFQAVQWKQPIVQDARRRR
jgi:hypothetical protein